MGGERYGPRWEGHNTVIRHAISEPFKSTVHSYIYHGIVTFKSLSVFFADFFLSRI